MAESLSYSLENLNNENAILRLDDSLVKLEKVSDVRAQALRNLGVNNIRDLLYYFPVKYLDLSKVYNIAQAQSGFSCTISAEIYEIKQKEPKPGLSLIEITLVDKTGTLIVSVFRQKWLADKLKKGDYVAVSGKLEFNYGFKRMTNPSINLIDQPSDVSKYAKVVPIYRSNKNISSSWIANCIHNALSYIGPDWNIVPPNLVDKYRLESTGQAMQMIHFPKQIKDVEIGKRTLRYTEALMHFVALQKKDNGKSTFSHDISGKVLADVYSKLPNILSNNFLNVFSQISTCLAANEKANLYIQCDKFSEKNILEMLLLAICCDSQKKCILLTHSKTRSCQLLEITKRFFDTENINSCVYIYSSLSELKKVKIDDCSLVLVDEALQFRLGTILSLLRSSTQKKQLTQSIVCFSTQVKSNSFIEYSYPGYKIFHLVKTSLNKVQYHVFVKEASRDAYDDLYLFLDKGTQAIVFNPLIGIDHNARNNMADNLQNFSDGDVSYQIVALDDLQKFKNNSEDAYNNAVGLEKAMLANCECATISENISVEKKLSILRDFKSKKIDVLHIIGSLDFDILNNNIAYIIVEDADRMSFSVLSQIKNILSDIDDATLCLISASKKNVVLSRLSNMQNVNKQEDLVTYEEKQRARSGIHTKLLNTFRDEAIIKTARKDALKILTEDPMLSKKEHKNLSYEISRICI